MAYRERKILTWFLVLIFLAALVLGSFQLFRQPNLKKAQTKQAALITKTAPAYTQIPISTPKPTQPPFPQGPVMTWISPLIPHLMVGDLSNFPEILPTQNRDEADILVDYGNGKVISGINFVLVAPFPTITDAISEKSLEDLWANGNSLDFSQLIVSGRTNYIFSRLWGKSSNNVRVVYEKNLLNTAWNNPGTWAIVPFEDLEPKWKVISINNQSPIQVDFDQQKYPLFVPISISGKPEALEWFIKWYSSEDGKAFIKPSNRDSSKLTTVMLTGVTALVRGTADMMELKGMTYPAQDIRDILRKADILHINNEVPFTPKCPPSAQRVSNRLLVFCSKPEYIALLEDIGTDIIELSGDHLQDWGPDAVLYTLKMYDQRGWMHYGGGLNIEDAEKPLLIEHNGNKIAFVGCNGKDKGYAGATATNPGAVSCDFDYLDSQIKSLLEQGYLPIVTFQHEEIWKTDPPESVKSDFYKVAHSGAIIASGSQSHQPQTFEFFEGSFLHFGLGNLFFDQVFEGDPNKQAFIDRHVFYDGKYISTELITTVFVDLARSRLMNSEERTQLLNEVFDASSKIKH